MLLAGSVLATGLLQWRQDMGARYLLSQMRLNPALLLRSGG